MGQSLNKNGLTKRAPDAGDSAHIPSSFLCLIFFLAGRLRRPRPSAGIPYGDDGANRWHAPCIPEHLKTLSLRDTIGL